MKKPGAATGALVGALLTAPLIALLYLADQLAGLSFVPYDVFDWMGRVLPGGVITFGIDLMVDTLIALGLSVADTAKTAEQVMAIGGLFVTGVVAGAVFFAILRGRDVKSGYLPGLALGLVVGVPVTFVSLSIQQATAAGSLISAIWILAAFLAWGAAFGWVYNNLSAAPSPVAEAEQAVSVQQISRREFLIRVGGATAAITVVGAGLGAVLNARLRREEELQAEQAAPVEGTSAAEVLAELPNADDPLESAPGTRPEYTPLDDHYRIDINTRPVTIDGQDWTLPITGLVDNPITLTLADLRNNYEPMHHFVTLSCISNRIGGNLISTTLWTGVSLQRILEDVGVRRGATHLRMTAQDGFEEVVALDVVNSDERIMLTYEWDGRPLRPEHGFPLRIYIPDRYGMKQPKWITEIEAIDHFEEGYWVSRGWDKDAIVRATSVIDTVAVEDIVEGGDAMLVPIGGIAYAGARGISKVEVKVDDGGWIEADLRTPLSSTTWVIWRYDWPFEAGNHTFYVRCREGAGTPQIEEVADPRPSGATGIHSVDARL
jgi:DMSO/TMAO reductase YedYZ molybdopterin-dependent catalytic subunit